MTFSFTWYIYILIIWYYIWVNQNISLTWIKATWGWFPLLTMIPVREDSEVVIIYPDYMPSSPNQSPSTVRMPSGSATAATAATAAAAAGAWPARQAHKTTGALVKMTNNIYIYIITSWWS
jgi:hypothetical protein